MPQLALADQLVIGLESVERDIAFFVAVGVAVEAVFLENGEDFFAVTLDGSGT